VVLDSAHEVGVGLFAGHRQDVEALELREDTFAVRLRNYQHVGVGHCRRDERGATAVDGVSMRARHAPGLARSVHRRLS